MPLFARYALKVPTAELGLLLAVFAAGELARLYPAGRLTDLKGGRLVLIPSLAVSAAMFFVAGWIPWLLTLLYWARPWSRRTVVKGLSATA